LPCCARAASGHAAEERDRLAAIDARDHSMAAKGEAFGCDMRLFRRQCRPKLANHFGELLEYHRAELRLSGRAF
jgi:hypothetical protein